MITDILTNNLYLSIVTSIATIFAVIAVVQARKPQTEIRYRVSFNKNKYLIAFWNNSRSKTIHKEEVFHFYICARANSTCDLVYFSNIEYPDVIIKEQPASTFDTHTKRTLNNSFKTFDFLFEVLPPREGFIILLDNQNTRRKGQLKSILINGILKDGNVYNYVDGFESYPIFSSIIIKVLQLLKVLAAFFLGTYCLFFEVGLLLSLGKLISADILSIISFIVRMLIMVGLLILWLEIMRSLFGNMPYNIRKNYISKMRMMNLKESYKDYSYYSNAHLREKKT